MPTSAWACGPRSKTKCDYALGPRYHQTPKPQWGDRKTRKRKNIECYRGPSPQALPYIAPEGHPKSSAAPLGLKKESNSTNARSHCRLVQQCEPHSNFQQPTSIPMSSNHEPPEQDGAISHENQPQVIVRGGKTYVCSACGTLVEIPADIAEQFVLVKPSPAETEKPKEPPQPPEPPRPGDSHETTTTAASPNRSFTSPASGSPPRRRSAPKRPPRPNFTGHTIDGLRVPSAHQFDRAVNWVSFHLKVLDRQHTEVRRLAKLLKQQRKKTASCRKPRPASAPARPVKKHPEHAHEDVSMAPACSFDHADVAHKRGPP